MNCCKINLGDFPHNEPIDTGVDAAKAGIHVLKFQAMNFTRFFLKLSYGVGDRIKIPALTLCEDFTYKLTIEDPNGDNMTQDVEGEPCENFVLRTFISTNRECDGYTCLD